MKKLVITAAALGLAMSSSFAQGFFNFDNSALASTSAVAPNLPTIAAQNAGASEGTVGQIIGSDNTFATPNYDMGYLYLAGTAFAGQSQTPTAFMGNGGTNGTLVAPFLGPTGTGLAAEENGAGLVSDGPARPLGNSGAPDGTMVTIQLIAWFDPTGSTTYAQAVGAGHNVGWSSLVGVRLAAGSDPLVADLSTVPGFTVGTVPEPSILALSGIGAAALMLVRRKK